MVIVDISLGGSYAPCMYYYRIRNERLHRKAMKHVADHGGGSPQDEYGRDDNVLLSYDDVAYLIASNCSYRTAREKLIDLSNGYNVSLRLDPWTAYSYYGYDAGDTLG